MTASKNPTGPDVTMLLLYSTPVLQATMPEHETLNTELKRIILEQERKEGPLKTRSSRGGWQSSTDMYEWGGESFQQVLNFILGIVDAATVSRKEELEKVTWRINCWANINRAGDSNQFHTHPGCFWSACYYVDDGGAGDDPSVGGKFEIDDPRGVSTIMYEPQLTFPGDGMVLGVLQNFPPKNGMVIIFPSWLSHGVDVYKGTGERISVSINFSVDNIKYKENT